MNVLQFLQDSVLPFLRNNGAWIAAVATCIMAIAVFLQTRKTGEMAKQNREIVKANEELVKQNNISISRDYIAELVVGVIEPMLSTVNSLETFFEKRKYHWNVTGGSHIGGDLREIVGDDSIR